MAEASQTCVWTDGGIAIRAVDLPQLHAMQVLIDVRCCALTGIDRKLVCLCVLSACSPRQ